MKSVKEQIDTCPATRTDLLDEYNTRYAIFEEYAPAMMSAEEVEKELTEQFSDVIATGNKGQIMKAVMPHFKGKADGKVIIRKHITTIILAVLAVIAGVYAYNYHDMKQNIVYNEHLDDVAVIVNGKELTLRDMAFYVAYEEMNVEKQALVYDSDNPNKYWNIHTNGEFVRVAARKAAMSMAIHDEIFYEMAKKESITLTDDEKAALKNSEKDFWYDLSDIDGAKKLGVEKKDIYSSMEKSAIARKYQEIYAGLDNADITDYDFSGGRYEKLLEKNNYKIKEKVWKRVDMGNVTLDH